MYVVYELVMKINNNEPCCCPLRLRCAPHRLVGRYTKLVAEWLGNRSCMSECSIPELLILTQPTPHIHTDEDEIAEEK